MGKAARRQRREVASARHRDPSAAQVADRAARAETRVLDEANDLLARAFPGKGTATLETLGEIRHRVCALGTWPEWCWLPDCLILSQLASELGPHARLNGEFHPALTMATTGLGAVAAWSTGRLAVRFDPELLDALAKTSLRAAIPVEVLRRLPAWGLWIDVPFGSFDGCFVTLTTSEIRTTTGELYGDPNVPRDTELLVAFVGEEEVGMARLWIGRGTIEEALRDQGEYRDCERKALAEAGVHLKEELGGRRPAAFFGELLSLLLYLCSDRPDIIRRSVPAARDQTLRQTAPLTVASAGYRVGAALRAARAQSHDGAGMGTGGRVASHVRSAHWHTYWTGPHTEPALRTPVVKWLHPILVNAGDDVLTVVRTATAPSDAGPSEAGEGETHLSPE